MRPRGGLLCFPFQKLALRLCRSVLLCGKFLVHVLELVHLFARDLSHPEESGLLFCTRVVRLSDHLLCSGDDISVCFGVLCRSCLELSALVACLVHSAKCSRV